MAAYRRVHGFGHVRADCRGPASAPEPYARFEYGKNFIDECHCAEAAVTCLCHSMVVGPTFFTLQAAIGQQLQTIAACSTNQISFHY